MNQQVQPSPRVHHFYVAIAKFLFYHPEYGIVTVSDPIRIKTAEQYGLSPLILYGLTVAGLPLRWMTFTPVDQPRPFRDVLFEAWHNAEGLRGQPDILKINRHIAAASPELVEEMANIGVQVEVADAKEKSLPASLGSAQKSSRWLMRNHEHHDRSLTGSIQTLCRYAQADHEFLANNNLKGMNSREVEDRIDEWMTLPVQKPIPMATGGHTWEPGPWLSSWETSLPPDQPRYFKFDGSDGCIWLMTGETAPDKILWDDDFLAYGDYDNAAEIAKNLVDCWPNPPKEIARSVGITLQELQWFISGKADLDQHARSDLESLLGIEYDDMFGRYAESGPYVLIARKPQAIKEAYEGISKGGDAFPCEIIPRRGAADPSWRYILINTYDEPPSIVMAPRGEKITERLPELLFNYSGIRAVSLEFYRDVVSTCVRACREPSANVWEMKEFGKRYEEHWKDCFWEPD
jgi:hypothetical protein